MDVDENLTSNDKVQVNRGKYDCQYGTITPIKACKQCAVKRCPNLSCAITRRRFPVPFVSKDLKKVEAFPQQLPADLDDPSPVPTAKKKKTTASNGGGSSASGGINNSAMPIEVFGNCDDDGEEEEEEQNAGFCATKWCERCRFSTPCNNTNENHPYSIYKVD